MKLVIDSLLILKLKKSDYILFSLGKTENNLCKILRKHHVIWKKKSLQRSFFFFPKTRDSLFGHVRIERYNWEKNHD